MPSRRLALLACLLALAAPAFAQPASPSAFVQTASPSARLGGEHYVPAHSSVRAGDGRTRIDLAVTLSIHNASQTRPLRIDRIDYYDGAGRRIEAHVTTPVEIGPFATHEVFVAKQDVRGGTGANFVVGWSAEGAIAEPVIEAVMIGDFGNQSYAFVSLGRRIEPAEATPSRQ